MGFGDCLQMFLMVFDDSVFFGNFLCDSRFISVTFDVFL